MIQNDKVSALLARTRRDVDDGLLPAAQIAVALDGELVVDETFGAPPETRFIPFSCTKALINATIWRLVGEGAIDLERPAAHYLPTFATNGKDVVTVEQILLHVGGFPMAPMAPSAAGDPEARRATYARWRLTLAPGETFMYHPVAGHWVLADIIEEVAGEPYADAVQHLVTDPVGLPRVLGIPRDRQDGIATVVGVGEPPTPDEMEAAIGVRVDVAALLPPEVALGALLTLNDPEAKAVGVPGGGAVLRAADLALLYQAFLHDPAGLWVPEVLHDATAVVRNSLPDVFGIPASRTRGGMVVKGDDEPHAGQRGYGRTTSGRTFGHGGAGGQIAYADPETGLSVAYITNGLDQNLLRERRRVTAVASLAGALTTEG